MGPAATVDFLDRILRATPAKTDQEHLHLMVDLNPQVPDRNAAVAGLGPSPGPVLAEMATRLQTAGADFLVMPCNAAHAFADDVRQAAAIPLLGIIEETADELARRFPAGAGIGILASSGCLEAGLYTSALAVRGLNAVAPLGLLRQEFMHVLYRVKAGERGPEVRAAMQDVAAELVACGATAIAAACTEVPLILSVDDLDCPLVNSTDVLVKRTIEYARGVQAPGAW
jgi:aspartate racemase